MMKLFNKNEKILNTLENKKKGLMEKMKKEQNITEIVRYKDELLLLKKEMKKIKSEKKKYLLNHSKDLYNYFETKKNESQQGNNKVKVINSFFSKTKTVKK